MEDASLLMRREVLKGLSQITFHRHMDKTAGASQEQSVKVFAPSRKAGSLDSTTGPSTASLRNISHSLSRMHVRKGADLIQVKDLVYCNATFQ
jgi:hypothetical protein